MRAIVNPLTALAAAQCLLALAPFAAAQGVGEALRVEVTTQSSPVYLAGEGHASVRVDVHNLSGLQGTADLRIRAKTFSGDLVVRQHGQVKLDGQPTVSREVQIPLSALGPVEVTARASLGDASASGTLTLSVLPPAPGAGLAPESAFGINGHIPSLEELKMMQRAGIKWCRCDWLWAIQQPGPGAFAFDRFDQLVADARECGISLLPILCYGVEWASTKPAGAEGDAANYAPKLEPWLTYVRENVARYKDSITYWEVWNEPNIGFWLSTDDEYVELLKATYTAAKEANPECKVLMGGTAGAPVDYIRTLYQAGCKGSFDVMNIHPYQYPTAPDDGLARSIEAVRKLMAEYDDAAKPIWITEIGYPNHTGTSGVDLRTQAAYLARTYVIALASGVDKLFWYDYQNGTDPAYNEHNFGIVFADNTPKPCLHALRTTADLIVGKSLVTRVTGSGAAGCLFAAGSDRVLVAWATGDEGSLSVPFVGEGSEFDLMGNARPLRLSGPGTPLAVTRFPAFYSFTGEASFLRSAALAPDPAVTHPGETATWAITGLSAQSVSAPGLPEGFAASPVAGGIAVQVPLAARPGDYAVRVVATATEGTFELFGTIHVAPPFTARVRPTKPSTAEATVTNVSGVERRIILRAGAVSSGNEPKSVPPGESLTIAVPLKSSPSPTGTPLKIEVVQDGVVVAESSATLALYAIRHVPGPVTIDGDLADWSRLDPVVLDSQAQVHEIQGWNGPEDLSSKVYLAWDESALYLAADVTDDRFCQPGQGAETWQGDGIQFAIDPACSRTPDAPHFEFDFARVGDQCALYRRSSAQGEPEGPVTGFEAAAQPREGGMRYELRLPWTLLPGLTAKAGSPIGLSILVNDNDGLARDAWIEWGGGIGLSKDPSQYLDGVLTSVKRRSYYQPGAGLGPAGG